MKLTSKISAYAKFVLGFSLSVLPISVLADEIDLKIALSKHYITCAKEHLNDDKARLSCFDNLLTKLTEWISEGVTTPEKCIVEDWNMKMKGHLPYLVGASNCSSGKLAYRMYDETTGKFLTSGFTYFDGFSFQDYPEILAWPKSVNLKYTIEEH